MRLVTIASFATPEEAEMARAALEREGITAVLEGAATVGNLWHLGGALGGVKLQVRDEDAARAREILDEAEEAEALPVPGERAQKCTHCGAEAEPRFDVCWSCGAELRTADEALMPGLDPKVAALAGEDQPVTPPQVATGDAMAARAWRAAVIGLFVCPPLLHLYSLWTLLRLGVSAKALSQAGRRNTFRAAALDAAVCALAAWLWLLLQVLTRQW